MNIFVLNHDPVLAAKDYCDKHVVKQILEVGQMLCAAHWIGWQKMVKVNTGLKRKEFMEKLSSEIDPRLRPPWKLTHAAHPCTQWAQRTWGNYMWLSRHGLALCDEYTERYGKIHKAHEIHRWLNRHIPPTFEGVIDNPVGITPYAICMPDDVKVPGDAVASYRNYYIVHKAKMARWAHSEKPVWFNQTKQETL